MRTKTWWTVLAIAVMSVGLLVGCSGGEGGDALTDVPASGEQPMEPGMDAPEATDGAEATEGTEAPEATEETAAPEAESAPTE